MQLSNPKSLSTLRLALPLLLSALTLQGCASGTKQILENQRANLPVLSRCPPLPLLKGGQTADLLANHLAVTQQYHRCRAEVDRFEDYREGLK